MYSFKMNSKVFLFSLILLFGSIALWFVAPRPAFAATPTTTSSAALAKIAASQPSYPAWVSRAAAGTAYTAAQFFNLPLETQLHYVEKLHPEISPDLVKSSYLGTTVADVNTATSTDSATDATAPTFNRYAMFARSASFALAAASTTYNSYIDLAPAYMSGGDNTVSVPMYAGTTNATANDRLNIGNLTAAQVAGGKVTTTNGDLTYQSDYTYTFDSTASTMDIHLTDAGLQKIINSGDKCYQGNKFNINIQVSANGQTYNLAAAFNIWLPQINRAQANIHTNTNLQLRYAYGDMIADSQETKTNQLIGSAYVDIPNFNVVDTDPKAIAKYLADSASKDVSNGVGSTGNDGVRVYAIYSDTVYQGVSDNKYETLKTADLFGQDAKTNIPLAIGNVNSPIIYGVYPSIAFDTLKHIHMYPDNGDANLIHLDYDASMRDQVNIDALLGTTNTFNGITDPLSFRLQSTLSPTNANQAMSLSQNITNTSSRALPGTYFTRGYDTMLGSGPVFTPTWSYNRYDNVPIYFGNKVSTGPRAGKVAGLYFRSPSNSMKYTLDFDFNFPNAPDGWFGAELDGILNIPGSTTIANRSVKNTDNPSYPFVTPSGTSMAGWPYGTPTDDNKQLAGANEIAYGSAAADNDDPNDNAYDTSINMKWSPAQVGTFNPDSTFNMNFNVSGSISSAPRLDIDKEYLRIPDDATEATISGAVSDLDSRYVNLYYTLDKPVQSGDGLPNSDSKYLSTVDLGPVVSGTNHDAFVKFSSQLTGDSLATLKQYLAQGHHIYVYAVDGVTDASGQRDPSATGYVSEIKDVRANDPVNITLNRTLTKGSETKTVTTKLLGYADDNYNLKDAASTTGSIFQPEETTLVAGAGSEGAPVYNDIQGYAPTKVQDGGDIYDLNTTNLPTNATGTLALDQDDLTINYAYTYDGSVTLTSPKLDFGQHPRNLNNGAYNLVALTGSSLAIQDTTSNKGYALQVAETTPLTSGAYTLNHGMGYQTNTGQTIDLGNSANAPVTVYNDTTNASANTNISDSWKSGNTYKTGPVLTINADNRGQVDTGIYKGVLTWTVVKSI